MAEALPIHVVIYENWTIVRKDNWQAVVAGLLTKPKNEIWGWDDGQTIFAPIAFFVDIADQAEAGGNVSALIRFLAEWQRLFPSTSS